MEKKDMVLVEQTCIDTLRKTYGCRQRRHDEAMTERITAIIAIIFTFVLILAGIVAMCIILYTGAMDNIPFIEAIAHGSTIFCLCTACGLMFCYTVQEESNKRREMRMKTKHDEIENLDMDDSIDCNEPVRKSA